MKDPSGTERELIKENSLLRHRIKDLERSGADLKRVEEELRVHQVELEMQNDELRRIQGELEDSRARYFDLYDIAPVGYFTISEKGTVLEANLTSAAMLKVAKSELVKRPFPRFILPEDQDIYYHYRKQLFETREPQTCELRMVRKDGPQLWVRLEAAMAHGADTAPWCRVAMSDITKRKEAEEERERLILELQEALSKVKLLSGLLPVCASCKKIRDDNGYWEQIEIYIRNHSEAEFSHGICPECAEKMYPEYYKKDK